MVKVLESLENFLKEVFKWGSGQSPEVLLLPLQPDPLLQLLQVEGDQLRQRVVVEKEGNERERVGRKEKPTEFERDFPGDKNAKNQPAKHNHCVENDDLQNPFHSARQALQLLLQNRVKTDEQIETPGRFLRQKKDGRETRLQARSSTRRSCPFQ